MFGTTYFDRILSAVGRAAPTTERRAQHGWMASKAGLAFACALAVLVFRHRWNARLARAAKKLDSASDEVLLPNRGRIDADSDVPASRTGSQAHDDWLLDEAVEESFPASDSPSAVRPGSIAGRRSSRAAIK